jgi:hypothetical protein
VLTTSTVAAVSVAGGSPIPTKTYPTFLDGLRAVVVELRGHAGQPQPGIALPCPKVTPLDATSAQPTRQAQQAARDHSPRKKRVAGEAGLWTKDMSYLRPNTGLVRSRACGFKMSFFLA